MVRRISIDERAELLPEPPVAELTLTTVLAALADPVRLTLLRVIADAGDGPIDCGDCAAAAPDITRSESTISHHYKVLRDAGITRTHKQGRHRIIEIRRGDVEARFPGLLDAVLAAPGPGA
ncbi:transcriptional regulator [Luteimicrobium album]|uniref:Transcriptional regulator n=2 Tax=Luteimicrobium album TaxID=1054550 RepID=A0ABQ6I3H1_9MICO|nr:helix-turn-helix domain-containing protein [Luteimicrobium album]GMA24509.1 transcriptional regulator [Luteimicrobium album]